MPPNTVRVSRPSKWGNRFRIGDTAERWGGPGICALVSMTHNDQLDPLPQAVGSKRQFGL